ncbi:unnamed protein product [Ceratitis capitata]|uniref:(Mediterranean fruit fly) hypothetical protein n=1 Tax=Ceratitis capitata TaxID=7213 RepID=A0A811V690_CERCA|nr:unnamed protein product [Ceratitis capitata]
MHIEKKSNDKKCISLAVAQLQARQAYEAHENYDFIQNYEVPEYYELQRNSATNSRSKLKANFKQPKKEIYS